MASSPAAAPPAGAAPKASKQLRRAFSKAKDRWDIDSDTLKGFYFHTKTQTLYCWEQQQGVLYVFDADQNCVPVWSTAEPSRFVCQTTESEGPCDEVDTKCG